jgi:hypothetical protein
LAPTILAEAAEAPQPPIDRLDRSNRPIRHQPRRVNAVAVARSDSRATGRAARR